MKTTLIRSWDTSFQQETLPEPFIPIASKAPEIVFGKKSLSAFVEYIFEDGLLGKAFSRMNRQMIFFTILCSVFLAACFENTPEQTITETLIGTWQMDSMSVPAGHIVHADQTERSMMLSFRMDQRVEAKISIFSDVLGGFDGYFHLHHFPNRKGFNILISEEAYQKNAKVVRLYENYFIQSLTERQMVISEPTQLLSRQGPDGSPYTLSYNRTYFMSWVKR